MKRSYMACVPVPICLMQKWADAAKDAERAIAGGTPQSLAKYLLRHLIQLLQILGYGVS